ncbi:MAG: putative baseplate assembly protein [bacterium]
MPKQSPIIDNRTATDISQQVRGLIPQYSGFYPREGEDRLTDALIGIFSRFAEIILERLNKVPEKNFLAFLDLLGASPLPPQPSRVPLTFYLASGSPVEAYVPAGTQVAAPPGEGEDQPSIFETESELIVTGVKLSSLFLTDPIMDKYADHKMLLDPGKKFEEYIFQANRPTEHILYIGHTIMFGFEYIQELNLLFHLHRNWGVGAKVSWEVWNGTKWKELQSIEDRSSFDDAIKFTLSCTDPIFSTTVNAQQSRWLRCRLKNPIRKENGVDSEGELLSMVREDDLPEVSQIQIEASLKRAGDDYLVPEIAFTNTTPLEPTQEFNPFGEKPKLYDALYMANKEAFSKKGATINLDIEVANSHLEWGPESVWPSRDLNLAWECWDGTAWLRLAESPAPEWIKLVEIDPLPEKIIGRYEVIVQGRCAKGVSLQIIATGYDIQFPDIYSPEIGEDGRFREYVTLQQNQYTEIEVMVKSGNESQSVFAAVYQEVRDSGTDPVMSLDIEEREIIVDNDVTGARVLFYDSADQQNPKEGEYIIDSLGNILRLVRVHVTGGEYISGIRVINGRDRHNPEEIFNLRNEWPQEIDIPIKEGCNSLLIYAQDYSGRQGDLPFAATTLRISRTGASLNFEDSYGSIIFSDGTCALCQSGKVKLTLPSTLAPKIIGGEENYWLRLRIIKGGYGEDMQYVWKECIEYEYAEGYAIVLDTFRPPVISHVKISYEQTISDYPESCFTYNNNVFKDVTDISKGSKEDYFAPFIPLSDDRKRIYIGFDLPSSRQRFPNSTITLFCSMSDFKFGEKTIPVSPFLSEAIGRADSTVTHMFLVKNTDTESALFTFSVFGTCKWPAVVNVIATILDSGESIKKIQASGESVDVKLASGESVTVNVKVKIPAAAGGSEYGFLRIVNNNNPDIHYGAIYGTFVTATLPEHTSPRLTWEYWNGDSWSDLRVVDNTEDLTRTGSVTFLAPFDIAIHEQFGQKRYWLRAGLESGEYEIEPRVRWICLNTIMASQAVTLKNEILGSSNGSENQIFRTTRSPVLDGQQLVVGESVLPSAEDREKIEREEGNDAITEVVSTNGKATIWWVRWHQVSDFYASGPRDRHYVIDRQRGEVHFGDGKYGFIPPRGNGNVKLIGYQTGGGSKGNKDAETIVQLKTTVPYIEKAINWDAAEGGADEETQSSFLDRAPRTIRHRYRAVTSDDYEDLAMLASPKVARSKCLPLYDLIEDPNTTAICPGVVSIIIVPWSKESKPLPSQELMNRVEDYLDEHKSFAAKIVVGGPEYIRVDVEVIAAVMSLEGINKLIPTIKTSLDKFLHPLTGGAEGKGWDFGRMPWKSDLYALIEAIPEVDYISELNLNLDKTPADYPELFHTGRFLIYSGQHKIRLTFNET